MGLQVKQHTETAEVSNGQSTELLHFTVDGEPQETNEPKLTAKQIMLAAGVDPKTHYLVQVEGQSEQVSFKGRAGEAIPIHEKAKFLSVSTGPTTVS